MIVRCYEVPDLSPNSRSLPNFPDLSRTSLTSRPLPNIPDLSQTSRPPLNFLRNASLLVADPDGFKDVVEESLRRHAAAINFLAPKGMFFWDYGNAFLLEGKCVCVCVSVCVCACVCVRVCVCVIASGTSTPILSTTKKCVRQISKTEFVMFH